MNDIMRVCFWCEHGQELDATGLFCKVKCEVFSEEKGGFERARECSEYMPCDVGGGLNEK